MIHRSSRNLLAPFGQRAARLIWSMRHTVEQHAANALAADIRVWQHEHAFAVDFMPAGSQHHRDTNLRLYAAKVVGKFTLLASDNLQPLGRERRANRRGVALQSFVRNEFFVWSTV